jgi:hypothetical protein
MLLMALLVSALSLSCSEDEDEISNLPTGWTQVQKTAFILGCTTPVEGEEPGTQAQCECFFDKVSAEYTYNEVQNASIEDALAIGLLFIGCI